MNETRSSLPHWWTATATEQFTPSYIYIKKTVFVFFYFFFFVWSERHLTRLRITLWCSDSFIDLALGAKHTFAWCRHIYARWSLLGSLRFIVRKRSFRWRFCSLLYPRISLAASFFFLCPCTFVFASSSTIYRNSSWITSIFFFLYPENKSRKRHNEMYRRTRRFESINRYE